MSASYPTSPKTFTVKTAAQKILAAHVNDMQDEITAIEAGLLNGTAPVNAAASTFTSLSVSGGSTLGTLNAGASTFASIAVTAGISGTQLTTNTVPVAALASTAGTASTATFYRGDGVWATPPAARTMAACLVSLSTGIAVAKNTEVGLDWLTIDDDKQGMHSTSVNSSRITFAASTGLYQVGVSLAFSTAASATGRNQYVRIVANDTTTVAAENRTHILEAITVDGQLQSVSGMYRATSTSEYVTVRVYQESDTTMSVLSTAVKGGKSFWANQVST